MTDLDDDFRRFKAEGMDLAGTLGDFQQRAGAYCEIYRHSEGNFVFPLIAAHGALWGAGHMRRGMAISQVFSRTFVLDGAGRDRKVAMVSDFTDALKEINRQVLIMTYAAYQMTRWHARNPDLGSLVPQGLIRPLVACHHARRTGQSLDKKEKRILFEAIFRWEQDFVVGPAVDAALQSFDWPLIRRLSMQPPIGFSYFGPCQWLWFRDFSDREERIEKGMRAFDIAMRKGLDRVEECLSGYTFPEKHARCLPV